MRRQNELRICIPTARQFTRKAFQCCLYEAQDVLAECADVDLIFLEAERRFRLVEQWQRRLIYRDITGTLILCNPGLKKVRLEHDYDLFVATCSNYWDLLYLNALQDWRVRCRKSVCVLDELWVADIPATKKWLHVLNDFDHVFIGLRGTVSHLSQFLGRTVHWLPMGVDALRFSPYPQPPPRVVNVYSVGRRLAGVHKAILDKTGRDGGFYIYDSSESGGSSEVQDHRAHRELYANVLKRSVSFLVWPAKVDCRDERGDQIEISNRYFEGAAAGAILLGEAPACEDFTELFGREDSVVSLSADGGDVASVLENLAAQPERTAAIGRRNALRALLRHDWIYRWKEVLQVSGFEPTEGIRHREKRLTELAQMAGDNEEGNYWR